jgi:glycine cleavage system H lipoate-binding protein
MRCPFLKEAQVRYCHASTVRKMIASNAPAGVAGMADPLEEKCGSARFQECGIYRTVGGQNTANGSCPYLHESLVQYCSAAPVQKYIPYSESRLSRCSGDAHTYCELYLQLAHPQTEGSADPEIEGIRVPERLWYSRNHMWIEVDDHGVCHVGIDGFLARLAGEIDRLHFLTLKGMHRPTVMLTIHGVDWPLVFPNPLLISGANLYLRSHPEKLITDPYRSGWLFEGWELPSGEGALKGLLNGRQASAWMEEEVHRASQTIHELLAEHQPADACVINDGGSFASGVAQQLGREELMRLLHRFAGAETGWERNS